MPGTMYSPKVSILTPCYNGEDYVARFLDSVLNQTYCNIQLIFINDGSTDKTEEIVLAYRHKFEARGIEFIYMFQQNRGQAAALNRGLAVFDGDYITWPDSDDVLHAENIERKVEFLEHNKEFGIVLCKSRVIDSQSMRPIGVLQRVPPKGKEDDLFSDLILERNVYFAPGGYMLRASCFLDVNPQRRIYESRGGQNWQMLLPVAYKYRCGYINECLYDYIVRPDSHSRKLHSMSGELERCDLHEDILTNTIMTIDDMNSEQQRYYIELIKEKYMRKRFLIAAKYRDKKLLDEYYGLLKSEHLWTMTDALTYVYGNSNAARALYKMLKRIGITSNHWRNYAKKRL